jgi:hypothetical protein
MDAGTSAMHKNQKKDMPRTEFTEDGNRNGRRRMKMARAYRPPRNAELLIRDLTAISIIHSVSSIAAKGRQ